MLPPRVEVAKVVSSHGLKGAVKARALTEAPERLEGAREIWLVPARGGGAQPAQLEAASHGAGHFTLKFKGVDDLDAARALVGAVVMVPGEALGSPPAGTYWVADLKDLAVVDEQGGLLGRLSAVYSTGAQDVYEISPERGESYLIPAIPQVVLGIDLAARRMTVRLMPGLGPETP
jgi:16S rRNA processing protein RimM